MKTLIVYDSFFGCTEKIAQEIGATLTKHGFVSVVKAHQTTPEMLKEIDLLILGSPTRAFSPSPNTKAFLKRLQPDQLRGVRVAAFDTRIGDIEKAPKILKILVKIFGYAAEPMLKSLIKKGGIQAVTPGWFYVDDMEGPVKEGELERAARWAEEIAQVVTPVA